MPANLLLYLAAIEIALKLSAGLMLLIAPKTLARALGLPPADEAFWPRLLGATLVGLGLASALEAHYVPGKSLGLYGTTAINLCVAACLGGLLILGRSAPSKRGRGLLWLAAGLLTVLGLVEIIAAA